MKNTIHFEFDLPIERSDLIALANMLKNESKILLLKQELDDERDIGIKKIMKVKNTTNNISDITRIKKRLRGGV